MSGLGLLRGRFLLRLVVRRRLQLRCGSVGGDLVRILLRDIHLRLEGGEGVVGLRLLDPGARKRGVGLLDLGLQSGDLVGRDFQLVRGRLLDGRGIVPSLLELVELIARGAGRLRVVVRLLGGLGLRVQRRQLLLQLGLLGFRRRQDDVRRLQLDLGAGPRGLGLGLILFRLRELGRELVDDLLGRRGLFRRRIGSRLLVCNRFGLPLERLVRGIQRFLLVGLVGASAVELALGVVDVRGCRGRAGAREHHLLRDHGAGELLDREHAQSEVLGSLQQLDGRLFVDGAVEVELADPEERVAHQRDRLRPKPDAPGAGRERLRDRDRSRARTSKAHTQRGSVSLQRIRRRLRTSPSLAVRNRHALRCVQVNGHAATREGRLPLYCVEIRATSEREQ